MVNHKTPVKLCAKSVSKKKLISSKSALVDVGAWEEEEGQRARAQGVNKATAAACQK
jgi:hypothetical protein